MGTSGSFLNFKKGDLMPQDMADVGDVPIECGQLLQDLVYTCCRGGYEAEPEVDTAQVARA